MSIRIAMRAPAPVRILVAIGLTVGAASAASAAHADPGGYGGCWQGGCNGLDPNTENCSSNARTVSSTTYAFPKGSPYYGDSYEVDLRYSIECEANWARVVTSTAEPFCIRDSKGDVQPYTSTPGLASWTNMDNGAPDVHDTAYLHLPDYTDEQGQPNLYAADQLVNGYIAGSTSSYC